MLNIYNEQDEYVSGKRIYRSLRHMPGGIRVGDSTTAVMRQVTVPVDIKVLGLSCRRPIISDHSAQPSCYTSSVSY